MFDGSNPPPSASLWLAGISRGATLHDPPSGRAAGRRSGTKRAPLGRLTKLFADRLRGPGGYYNAGNLLGLIVALATQFAVATQAGASRGGLDILVGYFVGSPSAVTLTVATIVFLISGEVYHRAWAAGRGAADPALNQIADVLSAIGATALTVSLMFLGQWLLALASGLLIVGGKLGSALLCDDRARLGFWPAAWVDPFRGAVLAGRLPGIAATGIDLGFRVLHWNDGSVALLVQPAVLIVCYLLWIKADLLLVVGAGTANGTEEASDARTQ
jgi:hypothetical protein